MAFHLACPITCLKICYCPLGFSGAVRSREGRRSFLEDVRRLDSLFRNPGLVAAGGRETAEVYVPRVSRVLDPKNGSSAAGEDGNSDRVEEREEQFSGHGKLSSLRKKAALASLVAEEYARKLEQGDIFVPHAPSEALMQQGKIKGNHPSLEETGKLNLQQEDKYSSLPMHVCRLCFSGEEEGTKRAGRMLTCQSCKRKYHRNCLKCWAKNRDLFNWASWVCPSCVTCESCRRVGDPNKLMFCKRCDTAYHCYCQQPPHKNVPSGPFLCPRHTWCHSCGSTVPGSGVSTRWFVGYTFCDACGRLFTKGKYCPICLKVYRDSESTPMVCCDVCQCWVHCQCDGISDEKYQQFQTDRNLYYKCGACRGECYKVKDQDDAVREIWRKRDEFEKDDMAKLREAAGLPSEDEMLRFCPSSDEDDSFPAEARDDMKKKFKAMIKGITEKGARHGKELKAKDSGKKVSKSGLVMKKQVKQNDSQIQPNEMSGTQQTSLTGLQSEVKVGDLEIQDRNSIGNENIEASSLVSDGYKVPFNPKISDSEKADEADNMESKNAVYIQSTSGEKLGKGYKNIRNSKPVHGQIQKALELQTENATGKPESSKSKKLVLHISSKNRNQDTGNAHQKVMLESSNSHREECSASSPGITSNHFSKRDHSSNHEDMRNIGNDAKRLHQDSVTPFRTGKKRATNGYGTAGIQQGSDAHFQNNASPANIRFQKNRGADFDSMHVTKGHDGGPTSTAKKKFKVIHSGRQSDDNENKGIGNANTSSKTAPLILKFKKPSFENTPFFQRLDEDEGNVTKGARSKRRRPSTTDMEGQGKDYADNVLNQDDRSKISDFNWILMHLGRDAVGKKVEVNKPSDGSWHKGSVTGIREHSSDLIVQFDTGREETIELSKQRVRFVSQDKSQNKKT